MTKQENQAHISMCVERYYGAFSFNWPYFTLANKNKFVYIYNAFNPTFVQRYQLPPDVTVVSGTRITDTYDLYVISETCNQTFKVLKIDLNEAYPKIMEIFEYPF